MDNTRIVQKLPPLEPGETEVTAFHINKPPPIGGAPAPAAAAGPAASANLFQAGASLAHGQSSTMRVDITTLGKDMKVEKSQVDLQLAPMAEPATWTRTIRHHHGQVKESEASCDYGAFHCKGDAEWCRGQESFVCQASAYQESVEDGQAAEAAQGAQQTEEPVDITDPSDAAVDTEAENKNLAVSTDAEDTDVDAEAERAAEQALQSVKVDTAFLQQRSHIQSRLQA